MADDYEVTDFQAQVLEASMERPVVVVFWAEWCGPCKMLEPIITELAQENAERWTLAKVNVGKNPQLAQQYQIQGIPALRIFSHGQIIAQFNGLMYKPQLGEWIHSSLPTESQMALAMLLAEIAENPDSPETEPRLEAFAKKYSEAPEAKQVAALIAAKTVFADPDKAKELTEGIYEDVPYYETVKAIRDVAELMQLQPSQHPEENESVVAVLGGAAEALRAQDFAASVERLIDVVAVDKKAVNELARRACVGLFTLLGPEHDITKAYRKKFDRALY